MGMDQGLEGGGGVMYVQVVSLDPLCIWQVQVCVYCTSHICIFTFFKGYRYFYGQHDIDRPVPGKIKPEQNIVSLKTCCL